MRHDIVESVRRFHDHGIQLQAGMIVGFDADTTTIFEQQAAFAQEARIPIVMAGMLQAIEGTPLFDRIAADGRLLSASSGDQFNHSNIVPLNMTIDELYAGYGSLLGRLYDWKAYEDRAVAFILNRGPRVKSHRRISRRDLRALRGVAGLLIGGDGLRRALFSWRLLLHVIGRRPSALREAVSFILMHKAMHDYTQSLLTNLNPPPVTRDTAHLDPALASTPPAAKRIAVAISPSSPAAAVSADHRSGWR